MSGRTLPPFAGARAGLGRALLETWDAQQAATPGIRPKINLDVCGWPLSLDTFTQQTGKILTRFTRMRAPSPGPRGFRFLLYHCVHLSTLACKDPRPEVLSGVPQIDQRYVLKGDEAEKVRAFCRQQAFLERLGALPRVWLEIKDDDGWFRTEFPAGVDELFLQVAGDLDRDGVARLYEVIAAALDGLEGLGV